MYIYDEIDQKLVEQRVAQFRGQTQRFLNGQLSEDEFRVLRLQNGLYIQRHAPMLRVAIPYGMLTSNQLRTLAYVARRWDKGYAHLTTRQNIQFNWPRLEDAPDILAKLATVQMHAIQTSGNCIRNTTTDHFAGVAYDEIINPLVWCEIIRQWSMLHPEFAFLPRKFKIAVSGSVTDRAAIGVHDIGLQAVEHNGEFGFRVFVGGGLGRTPLVGKLINPFVAWYDLLTYLQATLRVYNLHGRRDNKYKARIKILVKDLTPEVFAQQVNEQWARIKGGADTVTAEFVSAIADKFTWPSYGVLHENGSAAIAPHLEASPAFARWFRTNIHQHKITGYSSVTVSLKATGSPPGDITADQMDVLAEMADNYGFGELRVSHEQNIILPDVKTKSLYALWQELSVLNLATPNIGLITNIIACPGGDYCSLANAVSIPVAEAIQQKFDDLDYVHEIGELDLNLSGCMNSCGHHHVGHIGILGVDKAGEEWYQITLGGRQSGALKAGVKSNTDSNASAAIGRVIGPSFAREQVPDVIARLIQTYLSIRESDVERFIDVVDRVGIEPFKKDVYMDPLLAKTSNLVRESNV
ncbi:sulfite reductase [Methylotenera oryzisoli]|uniref:Sulfite reductase n=1 Tax=Methylotenera oryzisoli TaxID=2080758 RepID=A0A4Y9VTY4_9PROT|nr:nitrite/sulfite reductase [Methylotenera oryzisoli]TFW73031.1 sulfite reductase [Methylotenera oryzisoli]